MTAVLCGMTGTANASGPDEPALVSGPRIAAQAAQETPPAAPMISDQVARDGAVRVSWHDPGPETAEVTSYVVTAEPGGASTTVGGDSRSATVGDLTNGTPYRMSVVAHNDAGQSEPAPPADPVTPRQADVPMEPVITAVVPLDGGIGAQWVEPPDGGAAVTGYLLTAEPGGHRLELPADTTVGELTGLDNDVAHVIGVTAFNSAGASPVAEYEDVTPARTRLPGVPTDLRAVGGDGTASLSWQAPADPGSSDITEYEVRTTPGDVLTVVEGTEAEITGLDREQSYHFTVAARTADGLGPAGAPVGPIEPRLTVVGEPHVLSAQAAQAITAVLPDGTIEFGEVPEEIAGLEPGTVLMSGPVPAAPRGLLHRVTSVVENGRQAEIRTEQAGVEEVFEDTSVAFDMSLDPPDIEGLAGEGPGTEIVEPTVDGVPLSKLAPNEDGKDDGGPTFSFSNGALVVKVDMSLGEHGGRVGSYTATGTFKPTVDGSIDLTSGAAPRTSFSAAIEATFDLKAQLGVLPKWDKEWELFNLKGKCNTLMIGGYPLVWCPEFDMKITGEIGYSAGVTFNTKISHKLGAKLDIVGGDVDATPIDEVSSDGGDFRAFGSVQAKLAMPVSFTVFLYNVAGPGVTVEPYFSTTADTSADPWFTMHAGCTLDVFLKSREFFGFSIDFTESLLDAETCKWELFAADGPFNGIQIEPKTVETDVDEPVRMGLEYIRVPSDSTVNWSVVEGPGEIDSSGEYVSAIGGVATVRAVRPADALAAESISEATVRVGAFPPDSPSGLVAEPAPEGALLEWAPPADDGGSPITEYLVKVKSDDRTFVRAVGSSPAVIEPLETGVSYRFQVAAKTDFGVSAFSAWSEPVVPLPPDLSGGNGVVNVAIDEHGRPDRTAVAGRKQDIAISGDGRYVFFSTTSDSNLVPLVHRSAGPDANYLVRKDLDTGALVVASRGLSGELVSSTSWGAYGQQSLVATNQDGSVVAFAADDALLVHDLDGGGTWQANRGVSGELRGQLTMTDDGSAVAFGVSSDGGAFLGTTYRSTADSLVEMSYCPLEDCHRIVGYTYDMSDDGRWVTYSAGVGPTTEWHKTTIRYDVETGEYQDLFPNDPEWGTFVNTRLSGDGTVLVGAGPNGWGPGTAFHWKIGSGPITEGNVIPGGWGLFQHETDYTGNRMLMYQNAWPGGGYGDAAIVDRDSGRTVVLPVQNWNATAELAKIPDETGRVVWTERADGQGLPGVWLSKL
ncbi:fibronectin type III domain-containing protein [Saccharomonospora sp. NPDC006951]